MSSLWSLLAVSPPENREVSRVVVEPCSKSWISGTCRLGIPVTVLDGSTTVFRCVEVADSFIPVPRACDQVYLHRVWPRASIAQSSPQLDLRDLGQRTVCRYM